MRIKDVMSSSYSPQYENDELLYKAKVILLRA